MKSRSVSKREILAVAVVILAMVGMTAWAGVLRALGGNVATEHPGVMTGLVIAALLNGIVITAVWWRHIDEAAREAHKWAWFWGGSVGLAGVMVLFMLNFLGRGALFRDALSGILPVGQEVSLGLAIGLFMPVLGYLVAWSYWWFRRR